MAKKTQRDFIKKNMQQLPKNPDASCLLPFGHATGDHSKQFGPCLYVAQNY